MTAICPTVTVANVEDYGKQIANVKGFVSRLHIDLMDGLFAPSQSPKLSEIWLPDGITSDIHLMYQKPADCLDQLYELKPNMVIIHREAEVDQADFAQQLHSHQIKAGLALLHDTPVDEAEQLIQLFDLVLVFSGHLGYQGGQADLALLDKVRQIRKLNPQAEIAWDGGINDENAKQLVDGGVDVLNVGGYIQHSDDPEAAYDKLLKSLGE